jgi:hypothetical protein
MSAATTTVVEATPDALALATRELEPAEALALSAEVAGFITRIRTLTTRAKGIVVTGRGQESEEKAARVTRLALRSERVEALRQLKEMKASTLRRGRAFDGVAAIVREMTEPAEEYLKLQESFTERADAADRDLLTAARRETLIALGTDPAVYATLGDLGEEAWASLMETATAARDAKVEAAKQEAAIRAEAERLAAEKREAERQDRIRAEAARAERERLADEENARLRAEAAEREAAAKVERDRIEAERAAERAEAEAKAKAAQEAAAEEMRVAREATDKAARELAKVQAEAAQAKADAEQATRERQAADAARAEAEADAKKPTKAKYALLVAALTKIAAWGEDLKTADEPCAAAKARDALEAVGLGK